MQVAHFYIYKCILFYTSLPTLIIMPPSYTDGLSSVMHPSVCPFVCRVPYVTDFVFRHSKEGAIYRGLGVQTPLEIVCQLVLITNRKSHTGFRLVPTSVTLNDLERRNSPYFVLFRRIR